MKNSQSEESLIFQIEIYKNENNSKSKLSVPLKVICKKQNENKIKNIYKFSVDLRSHHNLSDNFLLLFIYFFFQVAA